jgi:uncharacterized protein YndB with AHSA1/START domain
MAQIAHLVRIHAMPEDVYARVASTSGIAAWFTQATSDRYEEGGVLELRFGDERVTFVVSDMTAPRRIAWHCTERDNPWFDTDIVFEFAPQGDQTVVRFDHLGWPEITDRFRDCSFSWAYFLESLRLLIEEGRGTPEDVAPPCDAPPFT